MSEEIIELVEAELKQIKNPLIQDFVAYTLMKAPAYLTQVASSSTGKYHPPQSRLEPYGLLNHLRSTVSFGMTIGRAYGLENDDMDVVIAACLLHDILKYSDYETGVDVKQRHTGKHHDWSSALFVHKAALEFTAEKGEEVPMLSAITGGIAHHMGRWTTRKSPTNRIKKFPEEYTTYEIVVHLADMCSANPNVHMLNIAPIESNEISVA